MPDIAFELAGFAGVAFYIVAYALLQFGVLKGSGYAYTALNLAAAILVLVSLTAHFNLYSAMIQIFWITLSIVGLTRLWSLNRRIAFSPQEKGFLNAMLPNLGNVPAHRLLRTGRWREAWPGEVIATEGVPVQAVTYLANGAASVSLNGKEFARLGTGALVGEMTWNSGDPASATVKITQPSTLFVVPAENLRALCRADPELADAVHRMVARDTAQKLKSANATMAVTPASP